MTSSDEIQISSALFDFRVLFQRDARSGAPRSLSEYLALFPGVEQHVAREYLALLDESGETEPSASGASLDGSTAFPTQQLKLRLEAQRGRHERYEARDQLGQGGMGVITAVWDDNLRRTLAMKTMLALGTRAESSFLEEAQVTGQLDHPGVVPVHDLGVDAQGRIFFTMRLVKGETAKEVFALTNEGRDGWTQVRALEVLLKVCDAMAYAHAKGVIHRDLKPANVMVGRFGEVYVMDWGVSRVLGREDRHEMRLRAESPTLTSVRTHRGDERAADPDSPIVTLDGMVVGTPPFMSPEQAEGRIDELSPRSDVYSVGAMLYQLLTGRVPYAPDRGQTSPRTVLAQVLLGPPKPVHELAPRATPELVAICERAMARDPAQRYADMREMAEDLRAFVENRVVAAYQTGARAEFKKWFVRNRRFALALSSAVVLAVVAGAGIALVEARGRREADEERAKAIAAAAKVQVLSDQARLAQLQETAAKLWPATPEQVEALQTWRTELDAVAARIPGYRVRLDELRRDALPYTDDDRRADFARDPRSKEVETLRFRMAGVRDHIEHIEKSLASANDGEELQRLSARAARLREFLAYAAPRLAPLERCATRRTSWELSDPRAQREHDDLAAVVDSFDVMHDPDPNVGLAADIDQRLRVASTIRATTIDAHGPAWTAAVASIADARECPAYAGLNITPQVGLVPIGRDPASGLWEFAQPSTGEIPTRDPQGKLRFDEASAPVFVLLPGGRFLQGAQGTDPNNPAFDAFAAADEGPPRQVELVPFLLSKFELTQAQWERISGERPSYFDYYGVYHDNVVIGSNLYPVTDVSWSMAVLLLRKLGLLLPSEAQWEYACRAGGQACFGVSNDPRTLLGAANWCDRSRLLSARLSASEDELDDHFPNIAAVGNLRPNAFGLHDMFGNVYEWCRDRYLLYHGDLALGDGYVEEGNPTLRPARGGNFDCFTDLMRCSSRWFALDSHQAFGIGMRPSRPLDVPAK